MRRCIPFVVLAALVVPQAASAKTYKVSGTAVARDVSGSTAAGVTTGTLGKGAVVLTTKTGANNTISGTFTVYDAHGSYSGTTTGTLTPPAGEGQPATVTGSGRVTKGTGDYKGAKGSFTFDATIAADGLISLKTKGSMKTRD